MRLALTITILLAACGGATGTTDGGVDAGSADASSIDGGSSDGGGSDGGGPACPNGTATLSDSCPFTACGGALDGDYCYSSVCLTRADLIGPDRIIATCDTADLQVSDFAGTARGSLRFAGGFVTRSVDIDATATLTVPASCAFGMCGTVGAALQNALFTGGLDGTVSCSAGTAGACNCALALTLTNASADAYTATGNTISLSTGRTYDYCVGAGGSLAYRETTTGRTDVEPGVQSLTAQ